MEFTKETIVRQLESTDEYPVRLSDVWEWLGYTRKDNAARAFQNCDLVEGLDYQEVLRNEELSGQTSIDYHMTIDAFKLWCMSARTEKGNEVRRYYLQIEKEWKAMRDSFIPDAFQLEAHLFRKETFNPWRSLNPEAANHLLTWEGVNNQPQLEPVLVPQSGEWAQLVDTLGLAANRAGLAGNKAIKEAEFLDGALDKLRLRMAHLESENDRLRSAENLNADELTSQLEAALELASILEGDLDIAKVQLKKQDATIATLKKDLASAKRKAESAPTKAEVDRLKTRIATLEDNERFLLKKDAEMRSKLKGGPGNSLPPSR
jgi:phage anti-repressor protein